MEFLRTFDPRKLDPMTVVAALALFVLVLVLWSAVMLIWIQLRSRRRIKLLRRLEGSPGGGEEEHVLSLWHEGKEHFARVASASRIPFRLRLRNTHRDAGLTTSPLATIVNLCLVAFLVGLGLLLSLERAVPALFGTSAVFVVFWWYLQGRISRRASTFERQLVDALELSSRALRAGHPLLSSFRLISEEIPAPVGVVFAEICQQQAMGVDLQNALRKAAQQSENVDLHLLSASMAINISCGGNVAEVAEGLASVIRDRMRLNRRFRVLISQTQFSKRILIAMPLLMFFVLNVINPEYMSLLYHTGQGRILLISATLMLTLGWWSMNKMSTLRT
jgi:tight adherence protein B